MSERKSFKLIAWFLLISIILSNLLACADVSNQFENDFNTPNYGDADTPGASEDEISKPNEGDEKTPGNENPNDNPEDGKTPENGNPNGDNGQAPDDGKTPGNENPNEDEEEIGELGSFFVSENWEDYALDLEVFTYGLLVHQLQDIYSTFSAYVQISTGEFLYGIGYTDYSICYTNEDETVDYVFAGFIPFYGENAVPTEDFDAGLIVYDFNNPIDEVQYILAYQSEEIWDHCVVFDKYLKYGINENGCVDYIATNYVRGQCDESLGSLYSYDEGVYLLDVDFGEYEVVTGESLTVIIDYDQIEREINKIIYNQDINFSTYDVESAFYTSQEAFESYLLSLQEETFMGYNVDELIEVSKTLTYSECFQITPDGLVLLNIADAPPPTPSEATKWFVGTACVVAVVASVVAGAMTAGIPGWGNAVGALTGAITGAAIDTFLQVIIENKDLDYVDWNRVIISSISGAISGAISPVLSNLNPGQKYISDVAIDAVLGGTEAAVLAWMDGGSAVDIITSFGEGLALAAAFSAVLNLITLGIDINSAKKSKLSSEPSKFVNNVSEAAEKISDKGDDLIGNISKEADGGFARARKVMAEKASEFTNDSNITKKSFRQLTKNLFDNDGNKVSKNALKEIFKDASDGDVIGYTLATTGEKVSIVKVNGVVGAEFPGYGKIALDGFLSASRETNFTHCAKKILEELQDNPNAMDSQLKRELLKKFTEDEILNMSPSKLKIAIKAAGWVFHENIDGYTISIVPKAIHNAAEGGIAHYGGFALIKDMKLYFAQNNLGDIIANNVIK